MKYQQGENKRDDVPGCEISSIGYRLPQLKPKSEFVRSGGETQEL